MVTIKKFLFDTEFDDGLLEAEAEPAPPPEPTFSQTELDEARAQGFVEGRKRGLTEAATADGRLAAEALDAIAQCLGVLYEAQAKALEDAKRGAVAIAAAIAAKIAPEIARRAAVDGIAALVSERLPDLMDEPRVVVRLGAAQIERVKEQLDATAKRVGFSGQFILLVEDGLDAPDCRIEWADGGTERLTPRITAEIDKVVSRYLSESLN